MKTRMLLWYWWGLGWQVWWCILWRSHPLLFASVSHNALLPHTPPHHILHYYQQCITGTNDQNPSTLWQWWLRWRYFWGVSKSSNRPENDVLYSIINITNIEVTKYIQMIHVTLSVTKPWKLSSLGGFWSRPFCCQSAPCLFSSCPIYGGALEAQKDDAPPRCWWVDKKGWWQNAPMPILLSSPAPRFRRTEMVCRCRWCISRPLSARLLGFNLPLPPFRHAPFKPAAPCRIGVHFLTAPDLLQVLQEIKKMGKTWGIAQDQAAFSPRIPLQLALIALRQVITIKGVFEPIWDAEKTPSCLEFVKCLFLLCLCLRLVQSWKFKCQMWRCCLFTFHV